MVKSVAPRSNLLVKPHFIVIFFFLSPSLVLHRFHWHISFSVSYFLAREHLFYSIISLDLELTFGNGYSAGSKMYSRYDICISVFLCDFSAQLHIIPGWAHVVSGILPSISAQMYCFQPTRAGDSPIYAVLVQPLGQTLGRPSLVWHGVMWGSPGHAGEPGCSCSTHRNVSVILASPLLLII